MLVSNKGDIHARTKAAYQERITQSLVLEPQAELDVAFQHVLKSVSAMFGVRAMF